MHPLGILLIGVAIVVGGVLILRLHPFLALILAALTVGALTPPAAIESWLLEQKAIAARLDAGASQIVLLTGDVEPGQQLVVLRTDPQGRWQDAGRLQVTAVMRPLHEPPRATVQPVGDDGSYTWHDSDLVIDRSDWQAARRTARQSVGERVALAFGITCGRIGLLIAMAAVIGKCLLDSGAADRIVRSALRVTGQRAAPAAFVGSGFLLAIPVFFDTVFYLMIPLGKALHVRTGRDYLLYVLAIIAGGSMAHSLVPPTPGPLFVAEELGVDLGLMILAGCAVGLVTSTAGYLFARFLNARYELPLRDSPDVSLAELQQSAARDASQLPPLWIALLPILLPIVLIGGHTLWEVPAWLPRGAQSAMAALGNKNLALTISAAIALLMLAWQRRTDRRQLAAVVQAALSSGGVIILITAAGGALGSMLQQTGVAGLVRQLPSGSPLLLIVLAFLITTAIRTAQGSATVAMITAAGVLSGLVAGGQLGCHPVYLALAIGCGSKPVMWMNDSGFWVMCKMSGMTEAEGLRYLTPLSIVMGVTGLFAVLLGAWLVPGVGL